MRLSKPFRILVLAAISVFLLRIIPIMIKIIETPTLTVSTTSIYTASHNMSTTNGTFLQVGQNRCNSCFVYDFNTMMDNKDICATTHPRDSNVEILILICTQHNRNEYRDTVRKTWMSAYNRNTGKIRFVFLLGFISDKVAQKAIEEENKKYGDIIQDDFVDSYKNLTYKTIMGIKWAVTRCTNARFIMKTDDDMYMNMKSLLNVLKAHENQLQNSLGGYCEKHATPFRNPKSKWYVSYETYPAKAYPEYCLGFGYILSMDVAKRVFDIHKHVPYFHFEDVYIGLCIQKIRSSYSFNRWILFVCKF